MKALIAYYSKGGNTKKIAEAIKEELIARGHSVDIEEIKPKKEHGLLAWGFIRIFKGECPIEPPKINNVSKYDIVCVGSPNWTRLSLPTARYLKEILGLKNKSVAFFSATAAPPGAEWYILSAYLLDLSLSKLIEKKKGRIITSFSLSSFFKRWSCQSNYGKKVIKNFCDKILTPAKPLKEYALKQKEIEESRLVIVFLLIFSIIFILTQIIFFSLGRQFMEWSEFLMFLAISFLTYFIIVTILGSKKAIFLAKYIVIFAVVSFWTLIVLFWGQKFSHIIIPGYLIFLMLTFFFHNVRAVIFSGFLSILSYAFLLISPQLKEVMNPVLDIPVIFFGVFIASLVTDNLRKYFFKLLEAQDDADEARISLEIKILARTRELQELAVGLEENIKKRTYELQEKINEMEKFNRLTVGRELRMIELKEEIKKLEEKLQKANKK
jgi:flavodoxin